MKAMRAWTTSRCIVRFFAIALPTLYVLCTQYRFSVLLTRVVHNKTVALQLELPRSLETTMGVEDKLSAAAAAAAASAAEHTEKIIMTAQEEEHVIQTTTIELPTVACAQMLRDKQNKRLRFPDPNERFQNKNTSLKAKTSYMEPTFWISLHHKDFDRTRWAIFEYGVYYETELEKIWREIVADAPPHAVIVDVGMNIGYFSLVSLAVRDDLVVHAFEPNPVNNLRMCESLELNHWLTTNSSAAMFIHPVGVSDENLKLPFVVNRANPGASRFYSPDDPELLQQLNTSVELKHVITLDYFASVQGWFDDDKKTPTASSSPAIKILKVDVEALELKVILGAKKLLQNHLAENIFVEVSARNKAEIADGFKALSTILEAGYRLVGHGGYRGPHREVEWKYDNNLVRNILQAAKAERPSRQLNLWFQYPVNDNKAMRQMDMSVQQQTNQQERPTSTHTNSTVAAIHDPINCDDLLLADKEGTLGFPNPNMGYDPNNLKKYTTGDDPHFWISLHNEEYDQTRWAIMKQGQYYERSLEKIWRQLLLTAPPNAKILDVGANIGYFSLVSLAMGQQFTVESFEPNPVNILRFCESLQLNGWINRTVRIHPVGVSDQSDILPFEVNSNPGASKFYPKDYPGLVNKTYTLKNVLSLDSFAEQEHWFDETTQKPTIVILKVDVEGLEYRVVAGARKLLQSHLVQNVFMEVSVRNGEEIADSRTTLSILLETGYKLVGQGGFTGPNRPVPWPHDSNLVSSIIEAARREPARQLNVWFQPTTEYKST